MESKLVVSISLVSIEILQLLLLHQIATAQIVSDTTLPINSNVTSAGNTHTITGGTQAGNNLFHSFEQFSIPTGDAAFFGNAVDIQNIFSRVTGKSVSNIDGSIGANGIANLFLINPNGIVFGPAARLNIGGSFLGTTASSIKFADGAQFNTKAPQSTPLLTIGVPIGLGFGSNPGAITVQSTGHNLVGPDFLPLTRTRNSTASELRVAPNKTLALIGGNLALEGGVLRAEGGHIELGSVGSGLVSINPTSPWTLSYEGVSNFRNIQLSRKGLADASGYESGSINLHGKRINLTDSSLIFVQNQGLLPARPIRINASELVLLTGADPTTTFNGGLRNETLGFGNGGDIAISTPNLVIQSGRAITTRTYGAAKAGNITINTPQSLQVYEASPFDPRAVSNISSLTFGSGQAGNVQVIAGELMIAGGAQLLSTSLGSGSGGNITIDIAGSTKIIGVQPNFLAQSSIAASTTNTGDAGNLTVNTSSLLVKDGGRVDSSTVGSGSAGSITINADKSVEIIGNVPGSGNPSIIISSAYILDESVIKAYGIKSLLTGASGNLTINTDSLSVKGNGSISVKNEGLGSGGKLQLNTNSINLDRGSITAATTSGEGGNIELNTKNLNLRNNSAITATAGNQGNGGNITINTSTLATLENSDITANAFQGRGGKIDITTQGLFLSPDSRITASSERGIDGVVDINTLGFDPTSAIAPLQTTFIPQEQIIAGSCIARRNAQQGKFVVTGSGGLPTNPDSNFDEFPYLTSIQPTGDVVPTAQSAVTETPPAPVEAQAMVATNGRILLTAVPQQITKSQDWVCQ